MTLHLDLKLVQTVIVALIGFLGAILGGRYSKRSEEQATARKTFELCYQSIFELIEYKFYSKDLSLEEYQELGNQFLAIFKKAKGYYYPSLKVYSEWLAEASNIDEAIKNMESFTWTFDRQYSHVCSVIGLPTRSRNYRANTNQYRNESQLIYLSFFDGYAWQNWLIIICIVALLFFFNL